MTFIERKLFHDKRLKLIVYENLSFNFIGIMLWWNLLKGSSSTIIEETEPFTKASDVFYLHLVVMAFIELVLFHNKKRNLTV
jgi:hypothetical protein